MSQSAQAFKFENMAVIVVVSLAMTACGQSFSLYSGTNLVPSNSVATALYDSEPAADMVLPVIEMTNVPLSEGIQRLMRQGRAEFTIDPRLSEWWAMTNDDGYRIHDPVLNFRWTNMTSSTALLRVLGEYHLILNEDPLTMVPEITRGSGFFQTGTNAGLPLIKFDNVPITVALGNLARAGGFNYMLDPGIGYGEFDRYGQIIREPRVTLLFTNTTAEQAFVAICFDNQLVITRDPRTEVMFVRHKNHDVDFLEEEFATNDTKIIPVIQFTGVPLSSALKNLARQAHLKCIFSPRIDTGDPDSEPGVSLRWENITACQAFAALCESYDLDVIKYPVSGFIRVEPNW
ncbi:MAG TPA: hypothetical protein VME24_05305 [Alphaproteobacteria bacterium]|nr:hypothetical protein [Alphaproteobacteria bacterium]